MDHSLWLAVWATMMAVHVKPVTSQDQCCPILVYETGVHVECAKKLWTSFQWSERGSVRLQEIDKKICWKGEEHQSDATSATPKPTSSAGHHAVVRLDLSSNALTAFPNLSLDIFGGLYHLNLSRNKIQDVTPALLRCVPRLQSLDLSFNSLTDFAVTSRDSFAELRHLNLSHNELQHLSTALLRSASRLQSLDLSFNRLSLVPEFPKVKLSELVFLDLSHNALQELPGRGLQGLSGLETLLVSGNQVGRLASDSLLDLSALRVLELHANRLQSLPLGVFDELSRLARLDLHGNALEALLKDTLKAVTELRALDLSDNKLNDVPPGSLRSLSSLRTLDLGSNRLESLSGGLFEGLGSLEHLTLSRNELRAISVDTFKGLNTLKDLDLRHNQLSTIRKASFTHMKKLLRLHLKSNSLKQLHEHVFAGLKWLELLDLSDNKLQLEFQNLPEEVFSPMLNLRTLLTHGNDARTTGVYPVSVFARLHSVSHLSLDTFVDTTFPVGGISALPRLRKLELFGCKLTSVKEATFEGFRGSSLQQLRLSGCPLRSVEDCAFCGLHELELLSITNSSSSAPVSMAGRVLDAELSPLRHLTLSAIKLNDHAVQALADGTLRGLRRLEVLDLSGNDLHSPNLTLSSGLKELLVARNQLRAVPNLTALTRFRRLDLSHNHVAWLPLPQRDALDRQASTSHGFTLLLHGNALRCPQEKEQMDFLDWLCSTHVVLDGGDTPGRDFPCVTQRDHVVTVGEALEEWRHTLSAAWWRNFAVAVVLVVLSSVMLVWAAGQRSGAASARRRGVSTEAEDDIMEPELSLSTRESGSYSRERAEGFPELTRPSHSRASPETGVVGSSRQGKSAAAARSSPDQGYESGRWGSLGKRIGRDSPWTRDDTTLEGSLDQAQWTQDSFLCEHAHTHATERKLFLQSLGGESAEQEGGSHQRVQSSDASPQEGSVDQAQWTQDSFLCEHARTHATERKLFLQSLGGESAEQEGGSHQRVQSSDASPQEGSVVVVAHRGGGGGGGVGRGGGGGGGGGGTGSKPQPSYTNGCSGAETRSRDQYSPPGPDDQLLRGEPPPYSPLPCYPVPAARDDPEGLRQKCYWCQQQV